MVINIYTVSSQGLYVFDEYVFVLPYNENNNSFERLWVIGIYIIND